MQQSLPWLPVPQDGGTVISQRPGEQWQGVCATASSWQGKGSCKGLSPLHDLIGSP